MYYLWNLGAMGWKTISQEMIIYLILSNLTFKPSQSVDDFDICLHWVDEHSRNINALGMSKYDNIIYVKPRDLCVTYVVCKLLNFIIEMNAHYEVWKLISRKTSDKNFPAHWCRHRIFGEEMFNCFWIQLIMSHCSGFALEHCPI